MKVLFAVVACLMMVGCWDHPHPDPGCVYDWECPYGYQCEPNSGDCLKKLKPSGTIILGCGCHTFPYGAFLGQTRNNDSCESGQDVLNLCTGCCDAFCNFVPWGRACL